MRSAVFEFGEESATADRRQSHRSSWSTSATRIAIGVAALGIGILVYLLDRRPEHTYFLARIGVTHALAEGASPVFGMWSQNLPAFLHVFAFTLITGGILACGKTGSLVVALGWFATDVAFEASQKFPAWFDRLIPPWFDTLPILESDRTYFRFGTFDVLDVIAIAIGAMAAYALLVLTSEGRQP